MSNAAVNLPLDSDSVAQRTARIFQTQYNNLARHTDRLFASLLIAEWVSCVVLAIWVTPYTWVGKRNEINPHVWLAVVVGGITISFPIFLAFKHAGRVYSRHAIAVAQMLMSGLLIHLTGGRLETHFHIFGSLAILAFYRDTRVIVSAAVVVYADHLLRGAFWPVSMYGTVVSPFWRSLEHVWWVIFEVTFLIISIHKSLSEMKNSAEREANLEILKESIEQTVAVRTQELTREIQERCEVENSLRKMQSQLTQAFQVARLGRWEWDLTTNQVEFSEEAQRLYGRTLDETTLSMDACLERVHPEDAKIVREALNVALRERRTFFTRHRVVLPDKSERVVDGRGELTLNEAGEPMRICGIVQDITESQEANETLNRREEQLRQSQKMEAVGRLAGGVAHDFNNLLTVINGYCSLSLMKLQETDPLHKNVSEIKRAAERAAQLTSQLLAFSRKQVLQPRVLDLNATLDSLRKTLDRLTGDNIEIAMLLEPDLHHIKADPGQLEQVVTNLVANAHDAMPNGGKLSIRTCNVTLDEASSARGRILKAGDYIMLSVSDTGFGMNDEVKKHLFEPFFTTKGAGKGTGLGLATCQGIIAQSEGDVRVYSEPNVGTTFKIFLPRTEAAIRPAIPVEIALPMGNESILIVEDDTSVRNLAVHILQQQGYQISWATNAFDALQIIRSEPPFDLIVSDVIMPNMSGKAMTDKILEEMPQTKILLMSGYTDDALVQNGTFEDASFSFLEKPFSPANFARKVREVLDSPLRNAALSAKLAKN